MSTLQEGICYWPRVHIRQEKKIEINILLYGVINVVKYDLSRRTVSSKKKRQKIFEGDATRTRNLWIWSPPLCRWSYAPELIIHYVLLSNVVSLECWLRILTFFTLFLLCQHTFPNLFVSKNFDSKWTTVKKSWKTCWSI